MGKSDDYHANMFLSKSTASAALLLKRYARVEQFGTRKELLRHTCHSCAWVIRLPLDVVVTNFDGLSPISVCTKMMQSRRHGSLPDRLKETLGRLRIRIANALNDTCISSESRACWQQLQRSLPKLDTKRKRAESLDDATSGSFLADNTLAVAANQLGCSDAHVEARRSRAVRRLSKHQVEFVNSVQQEFDVGELLRKAREASNNSDAVSMCQLLLKGSAWLAKPKLVAQAHGGEPMSKAAKQHLRSALQSKVRGAILICLKGLDLGDPGTCERADVQASVMRICEIMSGVALDQVMASKQWLAIRSFVDSIAVQRFDDSVLLQQALQHAPQHQLPRGALKQATPRRKLNRFSSEDKTPQGLLPRLIKKFLSELGEATAKDLIKAIRSSREWPDIEGLLNHQPTKQSKQPDGLTSWETSLATNLTRLGRKTGKKRCREIVWTL